MDKLKQIQDALAPLSLVDLRSQCKANNVRYDSTLDKAALVKKLTKAFLAKENWVPLETKKQANSSENQADVTSENENKPELSAKENVEVQPSTDSVDEIKQASNDSSEIDERSCKSPSSESVDNAEAPSKTREYRPSQPQNQQNNYVDRKNRDNKDYRKQSERRDDKHNNQNQYNVNPRPNGGRIYATKGEAVGNANNGQPKNYPNKPQGKPFKKQDRDRINQEVEFDENGVEKEVDLTGCEIRSGVLELCQEGYGFLRGENYQISNKDSFVGTQYTRRYGLRVGDFVVGYVKQGENPTKPPAIVKILEINGREPVENLKRPYFENFVPIYPNELIRLEIKGKRNDLAVRAIDLIAPIGKGQRAMVVSPPKAGKTTLLKMIANSISINHPECKLLVLLIDERPEEVTDMQRCINGEVVYSTFDEESGNHIKIAELVLTRAKRLVEEGHDVVILLDSLTRMARANNVIVPSSGKTLSGGVDPVALYFPKRFFGAARNIENGGSLTIIATALVDTGSRMDDIVYEEFKGTGNMEIHLDRRLSEKRIFPAIDLYKSGTRREELLLSQQELEAAYLMRKLLSAGDPQEAAESIITMMMRTSSNAELTICLKDQIAKLKKDGYRF